MTILKDALNGWPDRISITFSTPVMSRLAAILMMLPAFSLVACGSSAGGFGLFQVVDPRPNPQQMAHSQPTSYQSQPAYGGHAQVQVQQNHVVPKHEGQGAGANTVTPQAAVGEAAPHLKLAVMDIEDISGKLGAGVAGRGTDYLRATLNATRRFVVIDKSRQAEALKRMVIEEKRESYKECYDQSCQVPLGQALAADTILRTQIMMIGSLCAISSEIVDLLKEAAIGGGLQKFNCTEDGLGIAIEKLVQEIVRN